MNNIRRLNGQDVVKAVIGETVVVEVVTAEVVAEQAPLVVAFFRSLDQDLGLRLNRQEKVRIPLDARRQQEVHRDPEEAGEGGA